MSFNRMNSTTLMGKDGELFTITKYHVKKGPQPQIIKNPRNLKYKDAVDDKLERVGSYRMTNSCKSVDYVLGWTKRFDNKPSWKHKFPKCIFGWKDRQELKEEIAQEDELRQNFIQHLVDLGFAIEIEYPTATDYDVKDKEALYGFIKIHAPYEILAIEAQTIHLKKTIRNRVHENIPDFMSIERLKQALNGPLKCVADCCFTAGDEELQSIKNDYVASFQYQRKEVDGKVEAGPPIGIFIKNGEKDTDETPSDTSWSDEDLQNFFTPAEKGLLIDNLLNFAQKNPNLALHHIPAPPLCMKGVSSGGLTAMKTTGVISTAFVPHYGSSDNDNNEMHHNVKPLRQKFRQYWASVKYMHLIQPLDAIKNYFGSEVAICGEWGPAKQVCDENHVTDDGTSNYFGDYVMCPLCDGCSQWRLKDACHMIEASHLFDNYATIVFAAFISIWATMYLDNWKRENARLVHRFNVSELIFEEPIRPQFNPERKKIEGGLFGYCHSTTMELDEKQGDPAKVYKFVPNPVTGGIEPYFSPKRRFIFIVRSTFVVITFLIAVIGVTIGIIAYRLAIYAALLKADRSNASLTVSFTASVLNLVAIMTLDYFYKDLAVKLTEWENHKHERYFDNSLILKLFTFQFVNTFSSLFYVAFFKKESQVPGDYSEFTGNRAESCPQYGCMMDLTIQLSVIMVGKQFIQNFLEVCYPMIKNKLQNRHAKTRIEENDPLPWVKQMKYAEYRTMIDEYAEMALQFGFCTLFCAAFSLAPLFALINNLLEIRIDAWKFVAKTKRPPAYRSDSIGTWQGLFHVIANLSVLTNGLIIALTSQFPARYAYYYQNDHSMDFMQHATHPCSPLGQNGLPFQGITVRSNCSVVDPSLLTAGYCKYDVDPKRNTCDFGCHYTGYREQDGSKGAYYWRVVAVRFAFVIIFENVVFALTYLTEKIIPDIPRSVKLHENREEYQGRLLHEQIALQENMRVRSDTNTQQSIGERFRSGTLLSEDDPSSTSSDI
eukprot:UC4_evm6s1428